jgi:hypothetical protein
MLGIFYMLGRQIASAGCLVWFNRESMWRVLPLLLLLAGCRRAEAPFSVRDALRSFRIEKGFHIEPFLSEPPYGFPRQTDDAHRHHSLEKSVTDAPDLIYLEDTNGDGARP